MKYRKLKNGEKVSDSLKSVQMTIDSKCPKKWAFVDMETGDIWVHKSRVKIPKLLDSTRTFWSADDKAVDALLQIALPLALERVSKDLENSNKHEK